MPKVGKMKFPYTQQGMRDAQNYSKQSGKTIEMEGGGVIPKYRGGGMVPPSAPSMYRDIQRDVAESSMYKRMKSDATKSSMYRRMQSDAIKKALMEKKAKEDAVKKMILAKRISDMINQKGKTPSRVRKKKK
jgi:hypothetical protein